MDLKDFQSGNFTQQFGYRSFVPNPVNQNWVISSPHIQQKLEEATFQLGSLNAFSTILPQTEAFMRMHMLKEATTSSKIEGTQTNMEEAVMEETEILPGRRDDWQEVRNYMDALNFAIGQLATLPLSSRLFCKTHEILLRGVRGENKQPGAYRQSQNWIGGATIQHAAFVPPHPSLVPDLMSDLEKFLNNDEIQTPHLIRMAIAHYQFEAIHPFLDGNGRLGRLLITLYLIEKGILQKPSLYLSDFIEKNRQRYYNCLSAVSHHYDLEGWLMFFLSGVAETSRTAIQTLQQLLALQKSLETERLPALGRRMPNALKVLEMLYQTPVLTVAQLEAGLAISKQTAHTLVKDFVRLGILKEQTGYQRNRVFVFREYLDLFER